MAAGLWLLAALGLSYGVALAAGLLLKFAPRLPWTIAGCAVSALVSAPLLIPPDSVKLRAVSAFVSTELTFRLIDFCRAGRESGGRFAFADYCRFLMPFPVLLVVYADWQGSLSRWGFAVTDAVRILFGATGVAAGFVLLDLTAGIDTLRNYFFLDHLVTVGIFLMTIHSSSTLMTGVERLAGFDAPPILQYPYLARTPAAFWMRYNTRVHRWLYENVFRPSGGRHAPVRGTLAVFLVSAALHELMFDIATSTIDGYQFLFFLIQAPAVLASGILERLANRGGIAGKVGAQLLSIAWMTATSIFFFHGVHKIFPFIYVSTSWLP